MPQAASQLFILTSASASALKAIWGYSACGIMKEHPTEPMPTRMPAILNSAKAGSVTTISPPRTSR